jgi:predicted TIM-barrel fold metal-dependent hydrolase
MKMGIARGRFVIDAHAHAQRHAFKWKERGLKPDYMTMGTQLYDAEPYDNTPRLFYDMDRYGVDMCILMPGFAFTDELNAEIIQKYPGKFVANCGATAYMKRIRKGEEEWNIDRCCEELDRLLSTGLYRCGIGEGLPTNPKPDLNKELRWEDRFAEICKVMEVARKHKVPVTYHTGRASGYAGVRRQIGYCYSERGNPLLAHDIAAAFPDVPLIMCHGGMDGWWSEMDMEPTFQVAAAHPNVYLETGEYWAELYEKPLRDPNIGAEKLLWGTDWGAAHPVQWWPGGYPTTYFDQNRKEGVPAHQPNIFGWSLRQLDKLEIPQDDLDLILGGNAVRVYKLEDKLPHTRMFKQYLK